MTDPHTRRTTFTPGHECDLCRHDIGANETAVLAYEAGVTLCMECFENPDTHSMVYPRCVEPGCEVWAERHGGAMAEPDRILYVILREDCDDPPF
jgi:hypothetical protein